MQRKDGLRISPFEINIDIKNKNGLYYINARDMAVVMENEKGAFERASPETRLERFSNFFDLARSPGLQPVREVDSSRLVRSRA
jgi:hypothetical protein